MYDNSDKEISEVCYSIQLKGKKKKKKSYLDSSCPILLRISTIYSSKKKEKRKNVMVAFELDSFDAHPGESHG